MKKYLNYTEEEMLSMVKQNCFALQYVKKQTEEICLAAVKENGFALQFVKNQTEKICLEAIKKDSDALDYVEKYYQSIADFLGERCPQDYKNLIKNNK